MKDVAQVILFDRKTLEDREYWLSKLPREPRRGSWLVQPHDRPGSTGTAETGFEIAGALYEKLLHLTGGAPFLAYTALMSALKICLARYSSDASVIVGSPCRMIAGAQPRNALAIVDVIEPQQAFRDFLLQVRSTLLEAYSRPSYPFERLLRDLGLHTDGSGCPLFEVALALEDLHADLPEVGNAVTILVRKEEARLAGRVRVRCDLVEIQAVERLVRHVTHLLADALSDTARPVAELEMLSPEERWLFAEWNDTQAPVPPCRCVHQLFETWAGQEPDALAVAEPQVRLMYRELNERANQMARHLRCLGIGRGNPVAVCLPSSVDLAVSILAVLKAGGFYIALDPTLPAERLAFMLEDSAAAVLVTGQRRPDLAERTRGPWVCLEQDWGAISCQSAENLPAEVTLRDLAYVIYTSGSTGMPKGVAIEHGGLLNLVTWHRREYGVTPRDRASQLAGPGFDASVWEIWPYLAAGASVHFPDRETALAPLRLLQWIAAERITLAFFPTPLAEVVLDEPWPGGGALRALLTGGDKLHRAPRRPQPFQFLNHYGPTEATVVTTFGRVEASAAVGSVPPIGRPIANVRVDLLDRDLRRVPAGVAGEMFVAGAGLARGYIGYPDTTAERFLPDPFSEEPGGRLYRTGDLARYRPEGRIEFLGRIDQQVKIRGYRIELGEIEVVLGSHSAVLEAVVVSREDSLGGKRLVGYVVPRQGSEGLAGELRAFLHERLPEYMIPVDYVTLAALPLTPNGKVDRRALPAPPAEEAVPEGFFAQPRNVVEDVLVAIWAEVLGRERISLNDSFFELGGHSLLATQVMSRVRDVFQLELPLRTLFDGPTVAELAGEVDRARKGSEAPPLVAVPRTGDLPLSFAQERLWFLDAFDPGKPTYNIPVMLRLDGRLDIAALVGSLSEIVRRHETLRTRFDVNEAGPVQIVSPPERVNLPIVDLSAVAESVRQAKAQEVAVAEAVRPFNLSQGALIRATLLLLGDEHRLLLVTIHHIVSDGWSMDVLVREMSILYQAFAQAAPSPLPELPIQYADFAIWQRRWLQGEILERQLAYWKNQLGGSAPELELPTDHPRPVVQTYHGMSRTVSLPEDLTAGVKALARSHQTTLFMTLLAGFAALLMRIMGGDEVRVGTPIAGRNRTETEGLIGFFVNTLVLRLQLAGASSFAELLSRVRQVVLDAHTHQDLPFERLVQELAPERRLSHSPLFQVMFVFQSALGESGQASGGKWTLLQHESTTSKFDLSLALMEKGVRLLASFEYSSDLFDETTILRWSVYFQNFLASVVADPGKPLALLAVWTASERHQLITEWNDTSADVPQDVCMHELVTAQVERTPEAIAAVFEGKTLTYRELEARANRWSHHLRALGVAPDVRVAICVERSLEMLVGLLAVLKAGGAYVPLDPEYPRERLAFMIEDSGSPVLLTRRGLAADIPSEGALQLFLDEDGTVAELPSDHAPEPAVPAESPAYVIYTSGSTGRPKGVMAPHRGLVNRLLWAQRTYPVAATDKVLQKASFSFDFSFWECLGPLIAGARVVLARPGGQRDSSYLVRTICREEITLLHFVPSMLKVFLAEEGVEDCRSLRLVLTGGEALSPDAQELCAARLGVPLRNQYGPTEVSIDATAWTCAPEVRGLHTIPIGRPLDNNHVVVVDRWGAPCPLGVPGELCLGGVGVAHGYLGRPELTAERFRPDWAGNVPGERLYRTGDRVRMRPDGILEFLGRMDDQIKLRGFRIELGEVESVLRSHPSVQEAAAAIREDAPGDRRLVAYVVGRLGVEPVPEELREYLRERLPVYMIPSAFVPLDDLPLTPSGKLDRRALPAPEGAGSLERSGRLRPPRNLIEEIVGELWCQVLGREEVGVDEDFFALGGHSLLATQVVSHLRSSLGVEIPVRALFEAPTVARLAQFLHSEIPHLSLPLSPPIEPMPREGRLPLSFAQQRLWFLDQMDPDGSAYNLPAALRISGPLDLRSLGRAITEIARRHEVLRTTFPAVDGEPSQCIAEPSPVPLRVIDLRGLPLQAARRQAARLVSFLGQLPFDLGRGPLLRAALLRLASEEHQLVLAMHHIVSDGWSMTVLSRELKALYLAFGAGKSSPLPELAVQYADFASWQRRWLQGEVLEKQLSYWRGHLEGAPPETALPTDRPRPLEQSFAGAHARAALPADLSRRLAELFRRQGATVFMGLLAAFTALLSRSTGSTDCVVGAPIAGRNRSEIEDLIGFFVNTLVLRCDLGGDPDFLELVRRVREVALEAHRHQDLPFEKLVEELRPERSLGRSPLFQVMLDVNRSAEDGEDASKLRTSVLDIGWRTSKFDLTLAVVDRPGGFWISAEYSTVLFDRTTVLRTLDQLRNLLEDAVADPSRRLGGLRLLGAAERSHLLREWNDTRSGPLPASSVRDLIEARAAESPDVAAVEGEGFSLSYGELDARANRLAHRLRAAGVGTEVPVGILLDRSPELIVSLLAVMKAGGVYVPFDHQVPQQRTAEMLASSGAVVLLTRKSLAGALPGVEIPRLFIEEAACGGNPGSPGASLGAGDAAYVIYTSGSTGTPKGVVVEHGSLARYVLSVIADYGYGPADRGLHFSSIAFDASGEEIYPCLAGGGTLVLRSEEMLSWVSAFIAGVERFGVTVLSFSTAFWHEIVSGLQMDGLALPACVRILLTGGEALLPERVATWHREVQERVRLFNTYGPTETTIVSIRGELRLEESLASRVPIGRPLSDVHAHVVDAGFALVPIGIAGELCLGGECLARGYLGRPDLTAEKFVPDPFADEPGARFYRTGDLARHLADGRLEFLGRVDRQVKVRGFRIELGEIEAVLAAHPAIRNVAVVAREDRPGNRRLVGYVEAVPPPSVAELREWMSVRLPDYMVPSRFVLLEALPLTTSGKVDRRSLPAPEESPDAEGAAESPRTPVEEILSGIWCEVLGIERIGVEESFFDLGGHSLLATRVLSRVRRALDVELPLRDLFEVPTIAGLAERIERARNAGVRTAPRVEPMPRSGRLPLSFAQQRLWFLDQLQPGSTAYNVPTALRIEGSLRPAVLALALREVVRRHEILRTTFPAVDGEPEQRIAPFAGWDLSIVDLGPLERAAQEREVERLAREEARRSFDLQGGPVFRAHLVHLDDQEHVLLATMHHIVSDAWSMSVLARELRLLYETFSQSLPSPLPDLAIQYADFASWQRSWLTGEVLESELAYWRERLAGAPPVLELPADRPRPGEQRHRGAAVPFRLSRDLSSALQAFGRREGATLFMVLLASFQSLLGRYAQSDDVSLGTPIAGRNRVEIEDLIGFFINTLVLRLDLSGEPAGRELVARLRSVALDTYLHQDLPFEKLVEDLEPERRLGVTPLFQVLFVLQNAPDEGLKLPGVRLRPIGFEAGTSKFDLSLFFMEGTDGGGLLGSFVYDTDLFDRTTVRRMAWHLQALLQEIVAAPDRPVSHLSLLLEQERAQLLLEWNDTSRGGLWQLCVHELFEQQAARTPEAPALVCDDESLTYRELDTRAGQVAARLRALGAQPEVPVALLVERSVDMIVGVLGILKAGGAYVPIDPDSPRERIALLIEDSGAPVLLTQSHFAGELPASRTSTVFLDALGPAPEAAAAGERRRAVPGNLAYVIYTSGSTGKPKGVGVEHRHLSSYLEGAQERLALPAGASFATVSTLAADLGNTMIFPPLCTGGTLHVISRERLSEAAALAESLERFPVDCLKIVPSHLASLLDAHPAENLLPRRLLVLGGEASPWALIDRIAALAPDCRILNHYGPTETTVGILTHEIERSAAARPATVPLGRPIDRARLFTLGPSLQPVPLGLPGELFVGGGGVSRGYLGRPDLTGERFIPDAWSGLPGERLYRTGDRVRFLPDGRVEFLGRIDDQVKVRGFRVEPGEVEAVLREQEGVGEAVVLARVAPGGERALAAFVVPREQADVRIADLRAGLRARLPEHMVPATFALVDALPLTSNGKLDRQALLKIEPALEPLHRQELPRTWTEEVVAEIWCEVLGRERVGAEESFFDLGGHSLLATRVVSRLRRALGVDVPLRALFEASTVAALARCVQGLRHGGNEAPAPPIVPVPRETRLPLSFGQQRLWFLDQWEPGSTAYNVPHALHLHGDVRVQVLERALGESVRRHEILRTTFPAVDGEPEQRVHPSGWKLPIMDLRSLPREERRRHALRLAAEEAERPFDLAKGPVVRGGLLVLDREEHVLLLTMHHIASDGWSNALLIQELQILHSAFTVGEPSPLPELPIQYADFAHWQRQWLAGPVLEREMAYWQGKLGGMPSVTELPLDRPRPAFQSSRGGFEPSLLPAELRTSLAAVARREGATLFMTLLAAFQALLARCGAGEDVGIGTPVAGRHRIETEPLIGFFVNTLVLRADLSGDPDFRKLLSRVRDTALEAHAHQDLPFEKLVDELEPERSLSHSPLFQVLFALQNVPRGDLELTGLHLSGFGSGGTTAKFDLSLALEERASGLSGGLGYRTDLFDRTTVRRLLSHYAILLGGLASDPGMRLSELPLLAPGELDQVLTAWNATAAVVPRLCVHEMFTAQAARAPDAVAVVCGGESLTFRELDTLSDAWAQALIHRGVGPEVPVGVCLEREPALVAVLLGVLKAGGCYVPIDPAYPEGRRLYMLEDSGARLLLTREALRSRFAAFGGDILTLEADAIPASRPVSPGTRAVAENLAYVIYTSGSTGRPKGVAIEHRSTSAFLAWAREIFSPEDLAGVLASTSVCFDLSVFELFAPLAWGGRIVLVQNALELAQRLVDAEVRLINTVPSVLRELLDAKAVPSSVRTINLAGEPLSRALVERLEAETAAERVLNLYGPTEDTTYSTFCAVSTRSPGSPPIGIPIAGTQAYVVDAWGKAAPTGISGELLLGGDGLARGYLGRPELTAELFVPDPFGRQLGQRLYKTGDRARRRPDGSLEFLGRIDHQVKVRGFRIEPGEIEAVLRAHPAVREAVVVLREPAPGDARLVAYVVPSDETFAVADLREHLRGRLPEHMIPVSLMALDRLPLTPNGKLDRRALPLPEPRRPGHAPEITSPRDLLELRLAEIWEDLLNVRPVGIRDDFFELGGHSLLAVRLTSRIERLTGTRLPLVTLFQERTIERLALRLRRPPSESSSVLVPLQPTGRRSPLFLVHPVGGHLMGYLPLARRLAAEQPVYGFHAEAAAESGALQGGIADLAERYVAELLAVRPEGPYLLGGWSLGGVVAFEMARQMEAQGRTVDGLILLDSVPPGPAPGAPGPEHENGFLAAFAHDLGLTAGLREPWSDLARIAPGQELAFLHEQAHRAGAFPPDLELAALQRRFEVFRTLSRALCSYRPGPSYAGPARLFVTAERVREYGDAPAAAWKAFVPGLTVEVLPGDHYSLMREPNVQTLAERLLAMSGGGAL